MAFHLALKSVLPPKTYLPSLDLKPKKGLEQAAKNGDLVRAKLQPYIRRMLGNYGATKYELSQNFLTK